MVEGLFSPTDAQLCEIFRDCRHIAVVGHSPKPERPSYQVASYMARQGYIIYPVHPAVSTIAGRPCYRRLADIPAPVDMVNVFRRSEALPGIVEEILALPARSQPRCLWTQLHIYHREAGESAQAQGWQVVMNRCLMVEHRRCSRS